MEEGEGPRLGLDVGLGKLGEHLAEQRGSAPGRVGDEHDFFPSIFHRVAEFVRQLMHRPMWHKNKLLGMKPLGDKHKRIFDNVRHVNLGVRDAHHHMRRGNRVQGHMSAA